MIAHPEREINDELSEMVRHLWRSCADAEPSRWGQPSPVRRRPSSAFFGLPTSTWSIRFRQFATRSDSGIVNVKQVSVGVDATVRVPSCAFAIWDAM